MEIIVHYPEDNQNLNTLGEQIATLTDLICQRKKKLQS